MKQNFYSCTRMANIKKKQWKIKAKDTSHVKINLKTRNQEIYSLCDKNIT